MTNFFITLTLNCNLKCKYCYEESNDCFDDFDDEKITVDYDVPEEVNYNINNLILFLKKDPKSNIIFYGGEPTIRNNLLVSYIKKLPSKNMLLHTNGLLLDQIPIEYLNKIRIISISIDGNKKINDYYRGIGVYNKVISNIINIRNKGFKGEIIARMTVQEETDIFENVKHLLFLKYKDKQLFDSVHWQLNALFWKNDYNRRNFKEWSENSYNNGIDKLIKLWISYLEKGIVLHIYPFTRIMYSLIKKESTKLRCGAGYKEYNIQTDGNITPCPVMVGMKDYYVGNIFDNNPQNLNVINICNICPKCDIFEICGGRCLYANITMKWNKNGFDEVCNTIKYLINSLKQNQKHIELLINKNIISVNDFKNSIEYNSCEIIP